LQGTVASPQNRHPYVGQVLKVTDAVSYNETSFLIQNKSSKRWLCSAPENVRYHDRQLYSSLYSQEQEFVRRLPAFRKAFYNLQDVMSQTPGWRLLTQQGWSLSGHSLVKPYGRIFSANMFGENPFSVFSGRSLFFPDVFHDFAKTILKMCVSNAWLDHFSHSKVVACQDI
jgi:hypothetical protein